jgi:hypothetical protein
MCLRATRPSTEFASSTQNPKIIMGTVEASNEYSLCLIDYIQSTETIETLSLTQYSI